jgi:glutaminase
MAVLPGQFGLGVFSPRLDAKGNSFRGIKVCEAVSGNFALHTFKVARATSSSVLRVVYDASLVNSKRLRDAVDRQILAEAGASIRVYELQGELMFGSTDSVIRTVSNDLERATHIILDFRRVVELDTASAKLLAGLYICVAREGKCLLFTGTEDMYPFRRYLSKQAVGVDAESLLRFAATDRALEWCEDQVIALRGREPDPSETVPLAAQYLCQGFSAAEMDRICKACQARSFAAGETIFSAGEPADSFFFILSGLVDVLVKGEGKREHRLVTMSPGMSFGEFALVTEGRRSANVRAVVDSACQEIGFSDIDDDIKAKLLGNLARELARRLSQEARELRILG